MPFTLFWDMHSGGYTKEPPFDKIFIEAPEDEAEVIFYNRFGHNPHRVTCTCCGPDYSISEEPTLELATAYHRGCKWGENEYDTESGDVSLDEYLARGDVLVIRAEDIKDEERHGSIPQQGYVWVD